MNTTTDAPVLEIKRVLNTTLERVFNAWMKKEQWETWMGPKDCRCEAGEFEPHVGGRYQLLMHMDDGRELAVGGVFRTIERSTRIAFTWKWAHGDQESLVTILLREVDGKTELTLRHEGLLTPENRDGHNRGWSGTLDKLAAFLAKGQ